MARQPAAGQLAPQRVGPVRVLLDGDDTQTPTGERVSAGTTPGAYLDDEVVGAEVGLLDERLGDVRPEEVLSETAPSLVPWRPLGRGHGPSPRCP